MDLSQSDLGKLMGLSSQQVARWEKGESDISGSADALLRALYIEHAGGNLNLQALLKHLDELDATSINRNVFQNTDDGWKIAA